MEDEGKGLRSDERGADSKIEPIRSTKKGDRGKTRLLSGERVSKSNVRIEVCGNLDESSAAMGLAKSFAKDETIRDIISTMQRELILLGAELASTEPRPNSKLIEQKNILQLERWIIDLQKEVPLPRHFVEPGANPVSAALDLARSVVRRTERSIVKLHEQVQLERSEVLKYVNRLAFLLYTLARYAEKAT